MLPSEVIVLDKMPLLGSGKVDQMAVQKFVRERRRRRRRQRSEGACGWSACIAVGDDDDIMRVRIEPESGVLVLAWSMSGIDS